MVKKSTFHLKPQSMEIMGTSKQIPAMAKANGLLQMTSPRPPLEGEGDLQSILKKDVSNNLIIKSKIDNECINIFHKRHPTL